MANPLHFGPARVPSQESPEAAVDALLERGYTACEIDFEGRFWMDYDFAAEFGVLARDADIVLSVHAPIAGFMGHAERGKKLNMAVGMLDHSAGIAKAAGAELVVFHPGFLLGRTREEAIDSVVEQLAELRDRLERKDRAVPFGIEVMGRVRELGSVDDVVEISRRLGWVRPVLDFAHMHATSDGEFLTRRAVRRGAREGRRGARARRAVPHPLLGHRLRQPQRDEAPALRRGHAAGGAAGRGAARLLAAGDDHLRVARRGSRRRRSARSSGREGAGMKQRLLDTPQERIPVELAERVRAFCEPLDVVTRGVRRADRDRGGVQVPARAARGRVRAARALGARQRGRPRGAARRRPLLRVDARGRGGGRLQLHRAGALAAWREKALAGLRAVARHVRIASPSCSSPRSSRHTTSAASTRRDLDEAGAYAIGRAYVEQFEPKRIAVGRDMRLASPSVAEALIEGAADGGADVVDIGMVGTEMVYFAVGELGLDGGVMVTASHNPGEYIGMKIVRRGALPVGSESGLYDVRDRAVRGEWRDATRGDGDDRGRLRTGSSTACSRSSTRRRSRRCAS